MTQPTAKLAKGSIPLVGLGTWKAPNADVTNAVLSAIKAGYRHIDCAMIYRNELAVGEALEQAFSTGIVKREDLWVTSKLWNTHHDPEVVPGAIRRTLAELKLEYLDLYLIHWPISLEFTGLDIKVPNPKHDNGLPRFAKVNLCDTWKAMEKLVDEGLVRNIGVSNFGCLQLADLMAKARIPPAVNQIEVNPLHSRPELIAFCQKSGIHVTAYSTFGSSGGSMLTLPLVKELATKYGKSPAHILLRWAVDLGLSVLPMSTNPDRIADNINVFDFKLEQGDVAALNKLNTGVSCIRGMIADFFGVYPFE